MLAEFKIVADVAWYRLRKFEMANLGATAAICIALHLPGAQFGVRLLFGALLNLLVYLNNDYADRDDDAASLTKDSAKTAFLREHLPAAVRAQLGLLALLVLIAFVHGEGLFLALALGGGVCWAYSTWFKRRPGVDVLAMMAWGVAMPLVAVPPQHSDGWALLLQLGLFSGVFETIQVLRDHDEDKALGVRTTAVVLGPRRTTLLARLLLVGAALYATFTFGWIVGLPAAVAAFVPLDIGGYERSWNRIRALLGLTFLIECWVVYGRALLA